MEKQTAKIRLFVSADLKAGEEVLLSEEQAHYLNHVMRRKEGDVVLLFNGKDGEFLARIKTVQKKSITLQILEQTRPFQSTKELVLILPVIKKQAFDYALQKATECGVTKIYPVQTEYTDIPKLNLERAQAIACEASEQCRRLDVPEVFSLQKLQQAVQSLSDIVIYAGAEDGRGEKISTVFESNKPPALLIGPEGGFSPQEFDRLSQMPNVRFISLGERILKAETAVVSGLTLIDFVRS